MVGAARVIASACAAEELTDELLTIICEKRAAFGVDPGRRLFATSCADCVPQCRNDSCKGAPCAEPEHVSSADQRSCANYRSSTSCSDERGSTSGSGSVEAGRAGHQQ